MSGKGKVVLRLLGFGFIAAGALGGLAGPWPWVLVVLGLGVVVISGGFG